MRLAVIGTNISKLDVGLYAQHVTELSEIFDVRYNRIKLCHALLVGYTASLKKLIYLRINARKADIYSVNSRF
jgi:hypothetical protein